MFRRSGPETLGAYARQYGLLRDLRPETLRQYAMAADLYERWAGGPVRLDEMDEDSVSAWLRDYSATVEPNTVRSKKNQVLALWRAAADERLCEPPTRRVRSVKVPWRPPTAWDHAEVEQLLAACRGLKRWHRCGLRRSDWFDLAVRVAWDTGLRWGDLICLPVHGHNDAEKVCAALRIEPTPARLARIATCGRGWRNWGGAAFVIGFGDDERRVHRGPIAWVRDADGRTAEVEIVLPDEFA